MKIEDIEDSLPDGFHDAQIERLSVDYIMRKVEFDLIVWIDECENVRPIGRKGRLTVSGLVFFSIEPPHSRDIEDLIFCEEGPEITFSRPFKPMESGLSNELLGILPDEAFTHYFYLSVWQACIYIAAMDANFEWLEEPRRY